MSKEQGKRYNEGKLRYDLLHPKAQEGITKVLTFGANKYEDRNWEKGMSWSTVLASMKRHIAAIENGEDYDPESGLLHADHVQCNAHFLSAYYAIAPQFDDRRLSFFRGKKIGLDIDGILANFGDYMYEYLGEKPITSKHWNAPFITKRFNEIAKDEKFWSTIPKLREPEDIPFEPHCYITTRQIDVKVTEEWLDKNGFPKAKVYSVGGSKVEAAKKSGVEIFVDDSFKNFKELNEAGILTYLMDAPYNQAYEVGHKRIKSLKELT